MKKSVLPARRLLGTVTAVLVATAVLAPAALAQYPIESGTLSMSESDSQVSPGEEVRLRGGGFQPGESVSILFRSDPVHLKTVSADSQGSIDTTVTIPRSAEPGMHTLEARGPDAGGGTLVLRTQIGVMGEETSSSEPGGSGQESSGDGGSTGNGGSLPFTGVELLPLAGIGVAALAGGALLIVAGRRRAQSRHD